MRTGGEQQGLAEAFEEHRARLRAVAQRVLGSWIDADDAVQEAWLRLQRHGADGVENLPGWLTTVVGRISLDMLRARASRREDLADLVDDWGSVDASVGRESPEAEALAADELGPALALVLDALAPDERLVFVMHDLFAVPFDVVAPIVGRSPGAAKQLASRARGRVRALSPVDVDASGSRRVVEAFLAASRDGDFDALVSLLHPAVLLRCDRAAEAMGASGDVGGATAVARVFCGRALEAEPALVAGEPGILWAPGGQAKVVWALRISGGTVLAIEMLADADTLVDLQPRTLDGANDESQAEGR
jgi:RNA polymerase sigma factor (sigma-70 family)